MSDREAIVTDADRDDTAHSLDDAANKLLAKWGKTHDQDEDHSDEDDQTDAETDLDDEDQDDRADGDNDHDSDEHDEVDHEGDDADDEDNKIVKVKVGGELKDFTLGDLKRLAGRESALQTKESAAAERLKIAEEQYSRYELATNHQLERAKKYFYDNFGPDKIDWNLAPSQYGNEVYKALKVEAEAAWANVQFFGNELQQMHTQRTQAAKQYRDETTKSTLAVLEKQIPNFREVYPKLREFAISKGVPQSDFDSIIVPAPLLILHGAYIAEKRSKPKTKPVSKTPTRIVKPSRNVETVRKATDKASPDKAMDRLKRSGSKEDAIAALLANRSKK